MNERIVRREFSWLAAALLLIAVLATSALAPAPTRGAAPEVDCSIGDEVQGSPIFPLYMPFESGTWEVGGRGFYYGEETHSNANNDYYATDWNLEEGYDCDKPVYAVAAGTVKYAGTNGDLGQMVEIEHQYKGAKVRTRYAHLNSISVSTNQAVTHKTKIGTVGDTGYSDGCHLHFSFLYWTNGAWNSKKNEGRRPSPMMSTAGASKLCNGSVLTVQKCGISAHSWFPNGTLVKEISSSGVYLLEYNSNTKKYYKRLFPSQEAFFSHGYTWAQVIIVDDGFLAGFEPGTAMPFRNGTLLKGSGATVYVIDQGKKRAFASGEVFESMHYSWSAIATIPDSVLNTIPKGTTFKYQPTHPTGTLVKTASSGTVYVLSGGKKWVFQSAEHLLSWGYTWGQVVTISDQEMNGYNAGGAHSWRDGTLLKAVSSAGVYVIVGGKAWLFDTLEDFDAFGYCLSNVVTVSDAQMALITKGGSIDP